MTIAREEIFGPVLVHHSIQAKRRRSRIANDTPYGPPGFVQSGDIERARKVADRAYAPVISTSTARGAAMT